MLVAAVIDYRDADNVERDLQGSGAQGGDELGEGEDVCDELLSIIAVI